MIFMGRHDKEERIHYVNWDSVCLYRTMGGIGLVDLNVKNNALLNKWLY